MPGLVLVRHNSRPRRNQIKAMPIFLFDETKLSMRVLDKLLVSQFFIKKHADWFFQNRCSESEI